MPDADVDEPGTPDRRAGDGDRGNGSHSPADTPEGTETTPEEAASEPAPGDPTDPRSKEATRIDGTPNDEPGDGTSHEGDADGKSGDQDEDDYGPQDRGSGLIGEHAHETPHPEDWPYLERGDEKGMDKHPYCQDCGLVKYVGPDRPLPGGGLVNLLGRVKDRLEREGRTLTDAQKRVILQKLREENVDDDWGLDREAQLEMFEAVVSDVTGVERSFVHGLLHDILERRGKV